MPSSSKALLSSDPAGQSQGRELEAKNGSNFLSRLACEETKKDEFNEALRHYIYPFRALASKFS